MCVLSLFPIWFCLLLCVCVCICIRTKCVPLCLPACPGVSTLNFEYCAHRNAPQQRRRARACQHATRAIPAEGGLSCRRRWFHRIVGRLFCRSWTTKDGGRAYHLACMFLYRFNAHSKTVRLFGCCCLAVRSSILICLKLFCLGYQRDTLRCSSRLWV